MSGLVTLGLAGVIVLTSATNVEDLFDYGLYETLAARTIEDVPQLITTYLEDRELFLRILPPGDTEFVQPVQPVPAYLDKLPAAFLDGLIAHQIAPAIYGYRLYLAEEVTATGGRRWIVMNADSRVIWSETAPAGYDPFEALALLHADLVADAKVGDPETIAQWDLLKQSHDPYRLVLSMDMLAESDLVDYVWAMSLASSAALSSVQGVGMQPLGRTSPGKGLAFTNIVYSNGDLLLSVTHPSNYVNQVHLLSGSDLTAQDWAFAGFVEADTTEASSLRIVLESTTVSGNSSASYGGGVYVQSVASCTNSVVYFNESYYDQDVIANTVEMGYSCVPSNIFVGGAGNITNDPVFVDASAGDYRLQTNSPCVNTGTNLAWMTDEVDLDGNPRIADETVDMGAYERYSDP